MFSFPFVNRKSFEDLSPMANLQNSTTILIFSQLSIYFPKDNTCFYKEDYSATSVAASVVASTTGSSAASVTLALSTRNSNTLDVNK